MDIRCHMSFRVEAPYQPTGDQPRAIAQLVEGIEKGYKHQTLLGATGTGKTAIMAWLFEKLERPALVMAHNKTLVSQLYSEFRELLPNSAVELFISYYDVYTPEAYVPSKDLYIEKEAQINEEIDRLRHAATQALLLRQLIDLQFERNDIDFHRGTFRVRGDTLDIFPANAEVAERVEFWGDEIERISEFDPLTGEILLSRTSLDVYPAKHFIATSDKLQLAIADISTELTERV